LKTAETVLTIFIGWSENITRGVIIAAATVFAGATVIALS
jgi:hypothetical protein